VALLNQKQSEKRDISHHAFALRERSKLLLKHGDLTAYAAEAQRRYQSMSDAAGLSLWGATSYAACTRKLGPGEYLTLDRWYSTRSLPPHAMLRYATLLQERGKQREADRLALEAVLRAHQWQALPLELSGASPMGRQLDDALAALRQAKWDAASSGLIILLANPTLPRTMRALIQNLHDRALLESTATPLPPLAEDAGKHGYPGLTLTMQRLLPQASPLPPSEFGAIFAGGAVELLAARRIDDTLELEWQINGRVPHGLEATIIALTSYGQTMQVSTYHFRKQEALAFAEGRPLYGRRFTSLHPLNRRGRFSRNLKIGLRHTSGKRWFPLIEGTPLIDINNWQAVIKKTPN
jgi:hypothetical protein